MNLSYSNLSRNKVPNILHIFSYLLLVLCAICIFCFAMLYCSSEFMIYFAFALVIMTVIFVSIAILFAFKEQKIIKEQLWKNGTKVEGFIVDVGSILYRRAGKSRILF